MAPYINSVREHLPEADSKIVFDRYHIMGHLTKAVDTVRKREHRALPAAGDTTLIGKKRGSGRSWPRSSRWPRCRTGSPSPT